MKDSAILRMILEANMKELVQEFEKKSKRIVETIQIERGTMNADNETDIDYVHIELVT